jgi:predicted N-acetyltransferase YhbS
MSPCFSYLSFFCYNVRFMDKFTVRHMQPAEFEAVGVLTRSVFFGHDRECYERELHWWLSSLPRAPYFKYNRYRTGVLTNGDHEQIVAHAAVLPYVLRYGGVMLRVAGVGAVCTHPDYRGRGYGAAVLRDSLAYMAEQGSHLALLKGIKNYYERFGFNPVFPYYSFEVKSADAAALDAPLRVRDAALDDTPQMAALFEKHWSGRVTFTRSPELWLWRVKEGRFRYLKVIEDSGGRICGYLAAPEPTSVRTEAVVDSLEAALTVLAYCGRQYLEASHAKIHWLMPPDDALVYFARQHLPVTVSAHYEPSGGWMARMIDTEGLIQALLPEITAQASSTMLDFNPAALQLKSKSDVIQIGLKGRVPFALPHQDFIQVMFGSLRPAALALRPNNRLNDDAVRLLEALFPPRMAVLGCWDWF